MVLSATHIAARMSKKLLRKRWLIIFGIALVALVVQVQQRQAGHAAGLQLNYWREFFIFGVMLPVSWGLMFSLLNYSERVEQNSILVLDSQDGEFVLKDEQKWEDLAETIVEFPQSITPVISTGLQIYNPETGNFDLAAEWISGGRSNLGKVEKGKPVQPYYFPLSCEDKIRGRLILMLPPGTNLNEQQIQIFEGAAGEMALALKTTPRVHGQVIRVRGS
jgi:hypothetical protein